jgi:hypothetical protein
VLLSVGSSRAAPYVRMLITVKHDAAGTVKRTVPYKDFCIFFINWGMATDIKLKDYQSINLLLLSYIITIRLCLLNSRFSGAQSNTCLRIIYCTSIKKELKKTGLIILYVIDNIKWQ